MQWLSWNHCFFPKEASRIISNCWIIKQCTTSFSGLSKLLEFHKCSLMCIILLCWPEGTTKEKVNDPQRDRKIFPFLNDLGLHFLAACEVASSMCECKGCLAPVSHKILIREWWQAVMVEIPDIYLGLVLNSGVNLYSSASIQHSCFMVPPFFLSQQLSLFCLWSLNPGMTQRWKIFRLVSIRTKFYWSSQASINHWLAFFLPERKSKDECDRYIFLIV